MESQFGIAHVWAQGDFVSRSVAILLLLMSVASWAVIIIKALALVKMKKYASKAEGFWHSEDFGIALGKLGMEADNPFRTMALEGREAVAHHRKTCDHLHDTLDISDWITRSLRYCVDGCTQRLHRLFAWQWAGKDDVCTWKQPGPERHAVYRCGGRTR